MGRSTFRGDAPRDRGGHAGTACCPITGRTLRHRWRIDLAHALTLVRKGDATSVEIPEVRFPGDRSLAIMMNLVLPAQIADRATPRPLRFDVIHRAGPRVIGGSTYQVRVKR